MASDQYTLNTPPDKNSQKLITDLYQSLYNAIEMDSANEVKQFVAFGANIDYRYDGGKTPLMLAASMGNIDSLQILLELGANPNLVSEENMTAMDYAKSIKQNHITEILKASLSEELPIAETFPVTEPNNTSTSKDTFAEQPKTKSIIVPQNPK
jgi:ankyrin repeat protein